MKVKVHKKSRQKNATSIVQIKVRKYDLYTNKRRDCADTYNCIYKATSGKCKKCVNGSNYKPIVE